MINNQTHQEFEEELAKKQAKAARHYALTQNEVYREFWSRDPQVIVDSLNADFAKKLQWMTENTALGTAINAALSKAEYSDIRGVRHFTERCIVVMPPGFSYDETSFYYTTPQPPPEEPTEQ